MALRGVSDKEQSPFGIWSTNRGLEFGGCRSKVIIQIFGGKYSSLPGEPTAATHCRNEQITKAQPEVAPAEGDR